MAKNKHTAKAFLSNKNGSILPIIAVIFTVLVGAAGIAFDYAFQINAREKLQAVVDASVLAGASTKGDDDAKLNAARNYFRANIPALSFVNSDKVNFEFELTQNSSILGKANADIPLFLSSIFIEGPLQVGVIAEAGIPARSGTPCIHVLSDRRRSTVFNGGTNITAPDCDINVHSLRNPATSLNAGVNLDINRLCVAGTNILNNAGRVESLEIGCDVVADPYEGTFPTPSIPAICETRGPQDGSRHRIKPGRHCNTIFNGSPEIIFEPGLHIITGTMIWNSRSKILAEGVTFYFPSVNDQIRPNGSHEIRATAPTSGPYQDILYYENTSNPANNAKKRQFIFNGSDSEYLEGIIYLPNRNVEYNAGSNIEASRTEIIVNELTLNSGNWLIEPLNPATTGDEDRIILLR